MTKFRITLHGKPYDACTGSTIAKHYFLIRLSRNKSTCHQSLSCKECPVEEKRLTGKRPCDVWFIFNQHHPTPLTLRGCKHVSTNCNKSSTCCLWPPYRRAETSEARSRQTLFFSIFLVPLHFPTGVLGGFGFGTGLDTGQARKEDTLSSSLRPLP